MKKLADIKISIGEKVVLIELADTPASRDLLAQLPASMPMTRLRDREYYGRPAKPLSIDGKKRQTFENGDVGYTAGSGYFALFFDNRFDPEINDLIVMGKVRSDLSVLRNLGPSVDMRVERLELR